MYGLAGSGKSTSAAELRTYLADRGLHAEIIKLAAPLYALQREIYRTADRRIGTWEHDNELLRSLAAHLRRINPRFLVDDFLRRVHVSSAHVVINDDMRDVSVDYPAMRAAGFSFVRVHCPDEIRTRRMAARGDRNIVPDSDTTWGYDQIEPDWTIDTSSDRIGLRHQIEAIADRWLAHQPSA